MKTVLTIVASGMAAVVLLSACGEKSQSLPATANKSDEKAWQAVHNNYAVKTYQPGDKARWEAQMRTRSLTQNEYNKVN